MWQAPWSARDGNGSRRGDGACRDCPTKLHLEILQTKSRGEGTPWTRPLDAPDDSPRCTRAVHRNRCHSPCFLRAREKGQPLGAYRSPLAGRAGEPRTQGGTSEGRPSPRLQGARIASVESTRAETPLKGHPHVIPPEWFRGVRRRWPTLDPGALPAHDAWARSSNPSRRSSDDRLTPPPLR